MPSKTDIIQQNIMQQVALNSGQLTVTNNNGSYQYVDSINGTLKSNYGSASNNALSKSPAIYQTSMKADVYNYAKGLFGGKDVPPELIETLATMATYYSVQSGQSITSLFSDGVLLDQFLSTINKLRNNTSQLGYAGLNPTPTWANSPVLRASISRAISQYDASGNTSQRSKYNNEAAGFTFYAVDTSTVYIRTGDTPGVWEAFAPEEPNWPS